MNLILVQLRDDVSLQPQAEGLAYHPHPRRRGGPALEPLVRHQPRSRERFHVPCHSAPRAARKRRHRALGCAHGKEAVHCAEQGQPAWHGRGGSMGEVQEGLWDELLGRDMEG